MKHFSALLNFFCCAALLSCTILFDSCTDNASSQWKPVEGRIMTQWGEALDPGNVHNEYPRPIMVRSKWENLNGLWDYAIVPKGEKMPAEAQGKILVPFAIESALSGVGKTVGADNELWYRRSFTVPKSWHSQRIMLNFGAVDWEAEVFVNNTPVGNHSGGYTAFSIDITEALKTGNNILEVKVFDPTDDGYQAIGKQRKNPHGIWYTSVTGIWQTVWMEPVENAHIENILIQPNVYSKKLVVKAAVSETTPAGSEIMVKMYDGRKPIASVRAKVGQNIIIPLKEMKLWSPDSPFLYDLNISLMENGKIRDNVKSYAAMRKVSTITDDSCVERIALNEEKIFQIGTLDQGWWPDGLYTAPSDEALVYDIQKTKDLGFNVIRKHVKVEPQRWYYHCDRLGMMVWQDMPSGDFKGTKWDGRTKFVTEDAKVRTKESADQYMKEWKEIMDMLSSYSCIVMWVPFNEAWGQFNTVEIAEWTKKQDRTRLVNIASGGNLFRAGDVCDIHNYPQPSMYVYEPGMVNVLGEYGGIGLPVKGHLWQDDTTGKNWGYIKMEDRQQLTDKFISYIDTLRPLVEKGFAAAIYTQTTDVETEVNGLMTYDRKVMKVDEGRIAAAITPFVAKKYGESLLQRKILFDATRDKDTASLFTIRNENGMIAQFTNIGARLVTLVVPDRNGQPTDVVWGFEGLIGYLETNDFYCGPIVGRYANRIGNNGTFSIDGVTYQLNQNEKTNHLHGGYGGFPMMCWKARQFVNDAGEEALEMKYHSADGEEGYPGNMDVKVIFTVKKDNTLDIAYSAVTDKPTICNLSYHPYFNLHGTASKSIKSHILRINADKYTPTDENLIPTGEIKAVKGTSADFTKGHRIDKLLSKKDDIITVGNGGYDINYVLDRKGTNGELETACTLYEPANGIKMEIITDQPGLQFYSGQGIGGIDIGKRMEGRMPFSGVVLEPQNFPDAPNHPGFPNAVLRPGETYTHHSAYRFTAE